MEEYDKLFELYSIITDDIALDENVKSLIKEIPMDQLDNVVLFENKTITKYLLEEIGVRPSVTSLCLLVNDICSVKNRTLLESFFLVSNHIDLNEYVDYSVSLRTFIQEYLTYEDRKLMADDHKYWKEEATIVGMIINFIKENKRGLTCASLTLKLLENDEIKNSFRTYENYYDFEQQYSRNDIYNYVQHILYERQDLFDFDNIHYGDRLFRLKDQ